MEGYLIVFLIVLLGITLVLLWRSQSKQYKSKSSRENELLISLALAEQQAQDLLLEKKQLKIDAQELLEKYLTSEKRGAEDRSYMLAQQEQLKAQKLDLETTKRQFNLEFQEIANKILEEKTRTFTETNTRSLDQILNPLKEKIKSFEEKVDNTYKTEAAERNTLQGVIKELMEQSRNIKNEANSLTRALRGDSKKQGNWGEVILERVLERSGLVKDQEYNLQASLLDEEGRRLQPDAVINLPENKHLVIDSKVSLVAYERWVNSSDPAEKDNHARQHILSVENHIKSLSSKNYQELYQVNSPDFVLLFMPMESAFSMSVTYKQELFSEAWDRRVVIVSPSTLLATLRTIASIWKQERQTRNVLEIAREAGALYDKFVGFLQDMDKIGAQLDNAQKTHENARKKLASGSGNMIRRVENLKKLGAKASKQIDTLSLEDSGYESDELNDNNA